LASQYDEAPPPSLQQPDRKFRRNYDIDEDAVKEMFQKYDTNNDGYIEMEEFTRMLANMNLAPRKSPAKSGEPDV
jgi:EF hand